MSGLSSATNCSAVATTGEPELLLDPGADRGRHGVVGEAYADRARGGHTQPRRSDSQSQQTSPCHRWWSRMCGEDGGTGSSHWVKK